MTTDARMHDETIVIDFTAEREPSDDEIVAELVDKIGDLEWQLDLDDIDDPAGVDIAISAAAELALIYSHLGDMPVRDAMLDRLNHLVNDHRTGARTRLKNQVYAQLAAHPGGATAAAA
ncbi:MAG TPA: hypothetical protein VJM32_04775 [Candidatus Saccharimonadales bacterium]|nr:hypothetical protein [Candidatus Saccharimonadales bacterium]